MGVAWTRRQLRAYVRECSYGRTTNTGTGELRVQVRAYYRRRMLPFLRDIPYIQYILHIYVRTHIRTYKMHCKGEEAINHEDFHACGCVTWPINFALQQRSAKCYKLLAHHSSLPGSQKHTPPSPPHTYLHTVVATQVPKRMADLQMTYVRTFICM